LSFLRRSPRSGREAVLLRERAPQRADVVPMREQA